MDIAHKTNKEAKDFAIYPMQTINISGQRTLVLYDSGAMGEAVRADLAEKVGMSIIDERPQSFTVAGGDVVNTNYPLYEATIGPDSRGEYHTFSLLGMDKISDPVPAVELQDMTDEFKKSQVSSPLSKEQFPIISGGSDIQLIIGIKQSILFPTKLMVLKSGLQVWRSQIKDVYGSTLIFAGPHESVKKAYAALNMAATTDMFSLLFTSSYSSFRDHLHFKGTDGSLSKAGIGNVKSNCHLSPIEKFTTSEDWTAINEKKTSTTDKTQDDGVNSTIAVLQMMNQEESINAEKTENLDNPKNMRGSAGREVYHTEGSTVNDVKTEKLPPEQCPQCLYCDIFAKARTPRNLERIYKEEEDAGCTVDYRCATCAACSVCKKSERLRPISIREEAEEALIAKTTKTDFENGRTTCVYPFTENPEEYLSQRWGGAMDNYKMAESVLNSQRRKSEEVRNSVLRFHNEVYEKGFVAPLTDLPQAVQDEINTAKFKHFFCWRSVFKAGSVSTPARLVVDPTVSSFNDILAKGVNCLTSLYII